MLISSKINHGGKRMSTLEQTSFITLQDLKLSYSEAGKGEPILCLHGNPSSKSVFSNMMTKLDNLNIKLVALDRPGHNATDEIPNEKNPNGGRITLSVGVVNVLITDKTDTIIEIANYADKAVYYAKNAGKNAVYMLEHKAGKAADFIKIDF